MTDEVIKACMEHQLPDSDSVFRPKEKNQPLRIPL
jgi:hypothetical protein